MLLESVLELVDVSCGIEVSLCDLVLVGICLEVFGPVDPKVTSILGEVCVGVPRLGCAEVSAVMGVSGSLGSFPRIALRGNLSALCNKRCVDNRLSWILRSLLELNLDLVLKSFLVLLPRS